MTFQLIRQTTYDDFNRAVNNFLKDGWDLLGVTWTNNEKDGIKDVVVYYQVVVK